MPIPYTRERIYHIDKLMEKILKLIKSEAEKKGMPHPNFICEWGRYIVAPAQITVFKVIDTKTILHKKSPAKKWYVVDGSFMNDLLDTWAIDQKWAVSPVNNRKDDNLSKVWLAGSTCDSDDIYMGIDETVTLPDFDVGNGDSSMYIAFYDTGAYQDPLSAHHCMLSSPLKIIIENGHIVVARKRETPDDVGKDFGW